MLFGNHYLSPSKPQIIVIKLLQSFSSFPISFLAIAIDLHICKRLFVWKLWRRIANQQWLESDLKLTKQQAPQQELQLPNHHQQAQL